MYIYIIIDKNTVDSVYYVSTYICVSTVFHKIAKPDCLSLFHLGYISLKKMSENLVLSKSLIVLQPPNKLTVAVQ